MCGPISASTVFAARWPTPGMVGSRSAGADGSAFDASPVRLGGGPVLGEIRGLTQGPGQGSSQETEPQQKGTWAGDQVSTCGQVPTWGTGERFLALGAHVPQP